MKRLTKIVFSGLLAFSIGCEFKDFVAPSWDVNANFPMINTNYFIHEIIGEESNYYIDSVDNNVVLFVDFDDINDLSESLEFNGISSTGNEFQLNSDTIIQRELDDSNFVRYADFREGNLYITLYNTTKEQYAFNLTILNLINKFTSLPYVFSGNVKAGSFTNIEFSLIDYYLDNKSKLSNELEFKLESSSNLTEIVSFDYEVSYCLLENVSGKFKPTYTYGLLDTIQEPLGANAPNRPLHLTILKNSNLIFRNYADTDIKLFNLHARSVNSLVNTSVTLKYDYNNNGIQDSLLTFNLPRRGAAPYSESVFQLTDLNSNMKEFLGNAPENIFIEKDMLVNENYEDVSMNYLQNVITEYSADIPLRFRSDDYVTFRDTNFTTFTQDQKDEILKAHGAYLKTFVANVIPLDLKLKIALQDDNGNDLLVLTANIPEQPGDSFVYLAAAQVDADGIVIPGGETKKEIHMVLSREDVINIMDFGRIYIEFNYTTAAGVNVVRLRGNDFMHIRTAAEIIYRVNA